MLSDLLRIRLDLEHICLIHQISFRRRGKHDKDGLSVLQKRRNHITILSKLIRANISSSSISWGRGRHWLGKVPRCGWGAGSKNLIFLLTHSRPHYLLTHSPAHPPSYHQPAHRLLIHLLLIASSPLFLFYPSAALWHDGRISTNWNEKVNFPQIFSFHHR